MSSSKPKILVFCRNYLITDFQENLSPLQGEYDFTYLTDGRKSGICDTRKRFYERLSTAGVPTGFTTEDELDVIARCRYLRNLPIGRALQMLRAMASVLEEEMNLRRPRMVLAQMVDEYITHLLSKISFLRGIPYVGYIYSYFPGKAQIVMFSNGQLLDVRKPADEEIIQTLKDVSPDSFQQNYRQKLLYTKYRHLKAMIRYRVKQVVFIIYSWRDHDPLNLHYKCLPFIVERRRWNDFPVASDFHQDWNDRLRYAKSSNAKPIVYFPLAYFPESSTDYWVENKEILNYGDLTVTIIRVLSKQFTVVVKEHMHMLGGRDTKYYRDIKGMDDAISVPPSVNSNDVLRLADAVVIGGGSIGIESFLRDKPTLSFCKTSCWFSASGAAYLDISNISSWPDIVNQAIGKFEVPSEEKKLEFIRQCLRGTLRVVRSGRFWPICDPGDVRLMIQSALSMNVRDFAEQ